MPRRIATFWRSTYVLIAVIVVAATALAYYSYEYAREMAQRGEDSIVRGTRIVAQERVARIDSKIRDSDAFVFVLVDVGNLKDFPRRWSDIGRITPTVESVVVLDDKLRIAPDGFASRRPWRTWSPTFSLRNSRPTRPSGSTRSSTSAAAWSSATRSPASRPSTWFHWSRRHSGPGGCAWRRATSRPSSPRNRPGARPTGSSSGCRPSHCSWAWASSRWRCAPSAAPTSSR